MIDFRGEFWKIHKSKLDDALFIGAPKDYIEVWKNMPAFSKDGYMFICKDHLIYGQSAWSYMPGGNYSLGLNNILKQSEDFFKRSNFKYMGKIPDCLRKKKLKKLYEL